MYLETFLMIPMCLKMIVHIEFKVRTKCVNLIAVAKMSEKNTQDLWGDVRKQSSTHLKNEQF